MAAFRNIFACLVHEKPETVVDLVRNLRLLDPDSAIILYNGGGDAGLLERRFTVGDHEPFIHPRPRPMRWGALHDFALDCIELADEIGFDTLTIVDSDQLALRPGYTERIAAHLAGRPQIGLLGNGDGTQGPRTRIAPAANAWKEIELWRPFLRRFAGGEDLWTQWTFWPSTVLVADAARELARLFRRDRDLAAIMARSKIWATEEIVIPTLLAALGYELAPNPCSYEFVRYRARYSAVHVKQALARPDAFWVHPVPRQYDDPIRESIRRHHDHYAVRGGSPMPDHHATSRPLLRTGPILERMRKIEGWFSDEEGDLLIAASARALGEQEPPHAIVEVGSYCGRSTTVLASVVRSVAPSAKVYAIDPHEGEVGALDAGLQRTPPTLAKFRAAIAADGLEPFVQAIQQRSYETHWDQPIALLLVDGLHDYANVSRDFQHFEEWLAVGAYAVFHDYWSYYPGVVTFVDELLATGRWQQVDRAGSLIVLRRVDPTAVAPVAIAIGEDRSAPAPKLAPVAATAGPLVSCVMPTFDRRRFVPYAVDWFLRQDYEHRELVVVDDGPEPVGDLLPEDPRIRHIVLDKRHTIGAKRNLGAREANGELVAHWDDDDWSAPRRLSYQVQSLRDTDADVCGLSRLLYLELGGARAWRYAWTGAREWVSDGTLLYTKEFWAANPLPDTSMGLDCRFLWNSRRKKIASLPDETYYVATIHPRNTSPKDTRGSSWRPENPAAIAALLGDDFSRYL